MIKNKLFPVLIVLLVLVSLFGGVVSAFEIQTEYGHSNWEYNGRDIQDLDAEGEIYTFQLVDYDTEENMKFNPYFQHTRYNDAEFFDGDNIESEPDIVPNCCVMDYENNYLVDSNNYSSVDTDTQKRNIIANEIGFDLEVDVSEKLALVGNYGYQKIDFKIKEKDFSKYELGLKSDIQADSFKIELQSVFGNAEEKYTKQTLQLDVYPTEKLKVFAKVSRRENFDTEVINKQENVSLGFSSRF